MRVIVALLLLVSSAGDAGEILESSITLDAGVYAIRVEALIAAPPPTVLQFLTDYDQLTAINTTIKESRIVHTYSPTKHRVQTLIRACILFFCRNVRQLQDVEQHNERLLVATIIPAESDFRQGRVQWQLAESDGATRMSFTATLEPAFWVPPVIGPWLVKRRIVSELLESAGYMEAATQQTGTP
jgi:uncharacterized protein YndB with AHSA1/START domain